MRTIGIDHWQLKLLYLIYKRWPIEIKFMVNKKKMACINGLNSYDTYANTIMVVIIYCIVIIVIIILCCIAALANTLFTNM